MTNISQHPAWLPLDPRVFDGFAACTLTSLTPACLRSLRRAAAAFGFQARKVLLFCCQVRRPNAKPPPGCVETLECQVVTGRAWPCICRSSEPMWWWCPRASQGISEVLLPCLDTPLPALFSICQDRAWLGGVMDWFTAWQSIGLATAKELHFALCIVPQTDGTDRGAPSCSCQRFLSRT